MNQAEVIISQYLASLEMLRQTISGCPDDLWDSPDDKIKFWHLAYHALFYTHLYLQESEKSFRPWSKGRPEYHFIGQVPWPPHNKPAIGEPYDKETVLEYLAFCQREVTDRVMLQDLELDSGFYWLPFGKLELQFYSIRHIQQHTGELMERLGSRAGIELPWVAHTHDWRLSFVKIP